MSAVASVWRAPLRFFAAAGALVVVWGALELAGGRAATGALAGAVRDAGALWFAVAYLGSWFAAVLLAPPLALTGAVLFVSAASRQRAPRLP